MSRNPFPQKSNSKSDEILQLIHSDVCGPMQEATPSGNRYFATFIDNYSRYTTLYLLKRKSDVEDRFIEFVERLKTKFGKKPKMFRTDQGGESIAKDV
jgi:transposase InsO family protein